MSNKILISIAAYNESELENTVKSFYSDADNPENLIFSIVSQSQQHPNLNFLNINQLRYIKVLPSDSYGVSWARSVSLSQTQDFDYYFQIDAHTFSEKSWDTKIIEKYKKLKKQNEKIILTCVPAMYTIGEDKKRIIGPVICNAASNMKGKYFGEWPEITEINDDEITYYIQGACMFVEKKYFEDLDINPDVGFFLEEIVQSIRSFAKEYKIFAFNSPVIYHFYSQDRIKYDGNDKPMADKNTKVSLLIENEKRVDKIKLLEKYKIEEEDLNKYCEKTGFLGWKENLNVI